MPGHDDEIKENYRKFKNQWKDELDSVRTELINSEEIYINSYKRLTSINAWRELLIKNEVSKDAYDFFCEAQNDAVSSHVFAGMGAWREALKCLRSLIENVLLCEYYKDHPVELRLCLEGKHRLGFNEIINYFQKHPDIDGLKTDLSGLERLQTEYSKLSRAVHGTDANYRMTVPGGTTNLWSTDSAKLGAWNTREKTTITGINLILMALHYKSLQGASLPGLRRSIAITVSSTTLRRDVQSHLTINLNVNS